jgi:hypothetical protein
MHSSSAAVDTSASSAARQKAARLLIVSAALLSLALSVYLFFTADREQGIFVGLWVPSILSLGNLLLTGDDR